MSKALEDLPKIIVNIAYADHVTIVKTAEKVNERSRCINVNKEEIRSCGISFISSIYSPLTSTTGLQSHAQDLVEIFRSGIYISLISSSTHTWLYSQM